MSVKETARYREREMKEGQNKEEREKVFSLCLRFSLCRTIQILRGAVLKEADVSLTPKVMHIFMRPHRHPCRLAKSAFLYIAADLCHCTVRAATLLYLPRAV
jgi:hypothetical protein